MKFVPSNPEAFHPNFWSWTLALPRAAFLLSHAPRLRRQTASVVPARDPGFRRMGGRRKKFFENFCHAGNRIAKLPVMPRACLDAPVAVAW